MIHLGDGATLALLVFAALLAGFVDSIAGGGGLVTVPALLAVGLPPHFALGTNKGQAVFGAFASFSSFWRRGEVTKERAAPAFVWGFLGSCAGAALLLSLRPEPLKPVVLGFLVGVAAFLAFRGDVKPRKVELRWPALTLLLVTFGLGVYDGFFGPGVGSMLIVAFALFFGDSLTRASGNAKVVNLASNVAAVLVFTVKGTVLWRYAVPMAAANALGAATGARLAVKRGDKLVRTMVLVVVTALAVKLGADVVR